MDTLSDDDVLSEAEARERLVWGVSESYARALKSVIALHQRVATLEAHRRAAEARAVAAEDAVDALVAERNAGYAALAEATAAEDAINTAKRGRA